MNTRTLRVITMLVCLIALIGLSGCDMISSYFRANAAAVKWEGDIEEIASSSLVKEGKVFTIKMQSRIDAPIDQVWAATKHPERLSQFSDQYKKSEIVEDKGNVKILDLHVMALDNLQALRVRMEFNDETHTLHIKTLTSTIADIDGTYVLTASPDGTKTAYTYTAKQTDKVALPISEDVQRSAIKESFVSQVRAIKAQLKAAKTAKG